MRIFRQDLRTGGPCATWPGRVLSNRRGTFLFHPPCLCAIIITDRIEHRSHERPTSSDVRGYRPVKCPQCGAENREEAQFCKLCGGRLDVSCPACGNENPPDSKFCDGCGQPLANGRNSPPIESSTARPSMSAFQPDAIPVARGPTEGERKQVTVLFSDLSGYAALSERLDPEEIREITSRIFGEVARVVSLYDGFVEKYIGDAVVALFGVPKSHEDDHIRALKAAREIHQSVNVLDPGYVEKIGTRLTFHSGIATGLVVTGNVNLEKGTHGVAGDTINLASRLSGLATPGEILVGESTYLQSKGMFSFERLHPVFVKGKAERVIPYRLLEEKSRAGARSRNSGSRLPPHRSHRRGHGHKGVPQPPPRQPGGHLLAYRRGRPRQVSPHGGDPPCLRPRGPPLACR